MTIDEIIFKVADLNKQLRQALSTMEKSNKVKEIQKEIKEIQSQCPHGNEKYHWDISKEPCPYCGLKRSKNNE